MNRRRWVMRVNVILVACSLIMGLWLVVITALAPSAPKRVVAAEAAPSSVWAQGAPTLAAALRLDVHVEASANGEGSAHVVASSQGGQALAHIDTKGQASGRAEADAPALSGCGVCGALPLEQKTEDREQRPEGRGRPSEEGTKAEDAVITAAPAVGQFVILGDAVNLRAGPSLTSQVIGAAYAGEWYAVTGRSQDQAWWRVCCAGNVPAWVNAGVGRWVDSPVPLGTVVARPPPPSLPQGGGTPPTPLPPFAIVEQEQHSEANYATIYAWVQDGHGVSLEGYRLLVTKDGAPVTDGAVRFGETQPNRSTPYRQGTTRPSAPGGPEDKPYNLKLAFDPRVVGKGFTPVGAWAVQLLDAQGNAVAPVALFALSPGDDHMEMYLNYGSRK